MFRWKSASVGGIGARKRASRTALVVFALTISSGLVRESSSLLIAGRAGGGHKSNCHHSLGVHQTAAEYVEVYERSDRDETVFPAEATTTATSNANPFRNRTFLDLFHGSAGYVASHRDTLAVVHLPGDLMEDDHAASIRDLMNDIAVSWLLGIKIVIVAGCRYPVDQSKEDDHQEPHTGMVVTDHDSLRILKEEAGYVRFEVERQLAEALESACGSSTAGNVVSGNFYSARPLGVLDGLDYRYSGVVRNLESDRIHQVHRNHDIVLLTPLGASPTGEIFFVDSEYLAAKVAGELGANKLIYVLEPTANAGLRHRLHHREVSHLGIEDGLDLLDKNGVRTHSDGFVSIDNGDGGCPVSRQRFLVKLGWGMTALGAGVRRLHLISPQSGGLLQELFTKDGAGTMISDDDVSWDDVISTATVDDNIPTP